MTMAFVGGPRSGEQENSYTAVPSQVVPVYAPVDEGASVCADEQVVKKLGVYRRRPNGPHGDYGLIWLYDWESENPCRGWAESDLEHLAHG